MDTAVYKDATICAVATPIGEGGIGIIRISGPHALAVVRMLFLPHRVPETYSTHRLYYGWIRDPSTDAMIDEVLLSYMAAPNTYTREDVVEINCHSGYAVLDRILQLVLNSGARMADPGEFTRRAFLNGRIDLSQAENVIEIVRSRSQQSLQLAVRQLQGGLGDEVLKLRERLLRIESHLEAHMDFSDDLDDVDDNSDIELGIDEILTSLSRIRLKHETGQILREGLTLALIGKPNVGKSSLLNALLGRDRAIVTPHPGTTRDVVEDSFILSGVLVRVLDTAGIRREPDEIESMGIERTIESAHQADIILWLLDQSHPLDEEDEAVFAAIKSYSYIVLLNKADLQAITFPDQVRQHFGTCAPSIQFSALNVSDIEHLKDYLTEAFLRKPLEQCRSGIVPNRRQAECFDLAAECLVRAREILARHEFSELACTDLRSARRHLESVLGLCAEDELLDRIFSQFCIGK